MTSDGHFFENIFDSGKSFLFYLWIYGMMQTSFVGWFATEATKYWILKKMAYFEHATVVTSTAATTVHENTEVSAGFHHNYSHYSSKYT